MAEPAAQRPDMSDYGVDTPGWEALPWSWAAERLAASRNFWLVTVSAEGRPHSMPVWAVWHDDEALGCFSCAPGARKARNLGANPQAVLTTSDTVECVSIEGNARLLDQGDGGRHERAESWIDRYLEKYLPLAPDLSAPFFRQNLLFEFVPERAFGIIEREEEFAQRATRWVFS